MKLRLAAPLLSLALLAGCAQVGTAVSTTCLDIAKMPPAAVATLNAQDPHSALGILWIDVSAACVAGVPALGVSESWTSMLWGEVKVLIPQLLPSLLPLLLGLI